jgi:hypothetical protein
MRRPDTATRPALLVRSLDLPRDFDVRRTEHYQALRKPLDPAMFIDTLQGETRAELGALNDAMPLDWLEIRPRPGNQGSITLSPLDALPEPTNLGRLKREGGESVPRPHPCARRTRHRDPQTRRPLSKLALSVKRAP